MNKPAVSSQPASRPVKAGDHVFLVDGSSYIFRAYHALPPLTRKSDGLPVGAVSGFCNMMWRLLRETVAGEKPTHLAVVFDHSAVTFRNALYDQYKANRTEPPEDLRPQFGLVRAAVRAFDIECIEQNGFEADDLIATYARLAREAGATCTIVASDKDLMQLVRAGVTMYDSMKEKRIGPAEVVDKFGVPPEKVVEVQALAGDSIDNVPGVPGIGIKTAAQLVAEYGDVEGIIAAAQSGAIKQPKRRDAIIENAENARISRKLVLLDDHVPLTTPIDDLGIHDPEPKNLVAFLKAMEFTTITRRVAETYDINAGLIEPDPRFVGDSAWIAKDGSAMDSAARTQALSNAPAAPQRQTSADNFDPGMNGHTPQALAETRRAAALADPVKTDGYETVLTMSQLDTWIAAARDKGFVAFDTETDSLDPMQATLVGISLALAPGKACYIPFAHKDAAASDLFGGGLVKGQLDARAALEKLKPLLEDPSVIKIGQNIKFDMLLLMQHGVAVAPIDDTMLMSYALDSGLNGHGMDELSEKHLGHKPIAFKDVAGSGKSAVTFDRVPLDRAVAYAAEDADVTLRLARVLKPRLTAEHFTTVYETLERGMPAVLARMEQRGIMIDRAILARLSSDFAQGMARLEDEAYELAGEKFNIGSPKQLGDILFGRMGLPGAKKTASGQWGTGAGVLEELAEQGHALPAKILEWRQLSKLKSTYADALPTYIHPDTSRVHTSFALAATTTGRLSSSEPNIQNIPIRTEEGRKIRRAFIAAPGHKLISADYSQIELRILAHIADIPQLKKAFAEGVDIHAMTASEMFGVPVAGMDPMIRRRAKAINFGIIYGISAFGLANQLGIPREEAGAYIRQYFERFPGIRAYMDSTKAFVRENGFVTTIFGRRCAYPQIRSPNASERAFMERAAINAPIQGSAADIIRRAMLRMDATLAQAKLDAKMLLQVHDELVFEVPDAQVDQAIPVIASVMEKAAEPALQLSVPLQVDARAAQNWDEAH
ncbi:MAG: DNA polymerase I [Beijerinckiaceae bacterium]